MIDDVIRVIMQEGYFVRVRELPEGSYVASLYPNLGPEVHGISKTSRYDALREAAFVHDPSGDFWFEVKRTIAKMGGLTALSAATKSNSTGIIWAREYAR